MSARIFHITTRDQWNEQKSSGKYRHPSLQSEGFIHCSGASQVNETWRRIFGGEPGLIVLEIDVDQLRSEVRYEQSEPGTLFPHVYGPVNVDAVVGIRELP